MYIMYLCIAGQLAPRSSVGCLPRLRTNGVNTSGAAAEVHLSTNMTIAVTPLVLNPFCPSPIA